MQPADNVQSSTAVILLQKQMHLCFHGISEHLIYSSEFCIEEIPTEKRQQQEKILLVTPRGADAIHIPQHVFPWQRMCIRRCSFRQRPASQGESVYIQSAVFLGSCRDKWSSDHSLLCLQTGELLKVDDRGQDRQAD